VVVYLLLSLTLFFIWISDTTEHNEKTLCIVLFITCLILNFLWVYTFFGLQSPFLGLMFIILLFAILMATLLQTLRVSFGATLLLLPYLIVTFVVAYINYSILKMNPLIPLFPM
jgi:tryptophan-rich sensory protein